MSGEANRGKGAEAFVQQYLEAYDRRKAAFDWKRNHDAHTAGGRFPRQTGDFEFYMPSCFGVLEVKEVDHDFRLPLKNYTPEKVAKVVKRQLAGGRCFVVVRFTTNDTWRVTGIDVFRPPWPKGSWDLSQYPTYPSAKDALDSLGLFV